MRRFILACALPLLAIPLANVATAEHEACLPESCYCPQYDLVLESGDLGVAMTSHETEIPLSIRLTTPGPSFLRYTVIDYFYVQALWAPSLFSVWSYEETNGVPGLQRWDYACQECYVSGCADTAWN